jgi:hypothetical protein
MRIGRPFAGIAVLAGLLALGPDAHAHPPNDDFLNAPTPGPRLTLMPFVGPGFRSTYDHRFKIEKDMSELRTQVIGTVALPFAEVSANVDVRFFLMMFGASVGYHDEWHMLQFNPDAQTGRDRAGQPAVLGQGKVDPAGIPLPNTSRDPDTTTTYTDLHRDARAMKDQNADVLAKSWAFEEVRWGFLWPAKNFMGVSNLALRNDGRPDVTYDWENGTVLNGGMNLRWEGYAFFRERNTGFIGPALRAMYVPRNRTRGAVQTPDGAMLPDHSACQAGAVAGVTCVGTHEFEFHYGMIAGLRPNWVGSSDTLLFRAYATWGLNNPLFGTQTFRQPLQLLFAYAVDIDL